MTNRMRSCLITGGGIFATLACIFGSLIYLGQINPSFEIFGLNRDALFPIIIGGSIAALLGLIIVNATVGAVRRGLVLKSGRPATARVIKVEDSDFSSRNSGKMVVKLTLLVQPEGEPEFEAVLEPTFSVLRLPQVGATYDVRYDPTNHQVEIVTV